MFALVALVDDFAAGIHVVCIRVGVASIDITAAAFALALRRGRMREAGPV